MLVEIKFQKKNLLNETLNIKMFINHRKHFYVQSSVGNFYVRLKFFKIKLFLKLKISDFGIK